MRSRRVVLRHALICVWPVSPVYRGELRGARWRGVHAVEASDDTACIESRGLWHCRIAGSCVGRGGEVRVRSRRVVLRHAPTQPACGAGVSRVAVRGVVGRCEHAVAACGATACTESRGLWHRRIAGNCVGRGGEACMRSRRVAIRHAPSGVWHRRGVGSCVGRGGEA